VADILGLDAGPAERADLDRRAMWPAQQRDILKPG